MPLIDLDFYNYSNLWDIGYEMDSGNSIFTNLYHTQESGGTVRQLLQEVVVVCS